MMFPGEYRYSNLPGKSQEERAAAFIAKCIKRRYI
jgi:hypothetical protein